ncbi:MAG TPA: hypothetical protein VFY39_09775 [Gammaproteobacteria bacterium]|nr:hypothetical protein [Gammaproteobacteria bacterium]
MTQSARHQINALVCVIVVAHGIYWFASGRMELAANGRAGLAMAEVVVGLIGAVWFWQRARQASAARSPEGRRRGR